LAFHGTYIKENVFLMERKTNKKGRIEAWEKEG
jgi:hypothetical protein